MQASHRAIVHGILDTWKRCSQHGSTPDEPDFVAGLVLESTPILYKALSSIFQQYGLYFSLTVVFCHQTPKVHFSGMTKTSCELGDILMIHVHTNRTGAVTRNALLYQAKISSSQPHKISSAEIDQLILYTGWPDFEYYHSPPLSGQRRSVNPKLPHTGAQYMLIDKRPPNDPQSGLTGMPNTYPIGSCMPDKYLYDHNHLAAELFDFFLFRSGRAFADRSLASAVDGWSEVVWDLLSVGLQKAFNRKKSDRFSAARHSGGPVHFLDGSFFIRTTDRSALTTVIQVLGQDTDELLYTDSPEPPRSEDWPKEDIHDPDSGISIILLETSEGRME